MKVAQSCPTLCDPMDYTVHRILQARILEWVTFPFFRGSSQPRDRTQVSFIAGGFFTTWATREAHEYWSGQPIPSPRDLPNPGIEPGSPVLQADSLPTELSGSLIKIIVKGERILAASPLTLEGWSRSTSAQGTGQIPSKPESFRFHSFQQGNLQGLERSHLVI